MNNLGLAARGLPHKPDEFFKCVNLRARSINDQIVLFPTGVHGNLHQVFNEYNLGPVAALARYDKQREAA